MSEKREDKTRGGRFPWLREERRARDYKEALSSRMLLMAGLTALFVLLDPKLVVPIGDGQALTLGGAGFSLDIKGMVIGAIIIEGLKAIKEYWLGSSAGGQKQAESMTKIAEQAERSQALAVAAARAPALEEAPKEDDKDAKNSKTDVVPAKEVSTQPKEPTP